MIRGKKGGILLYMLGVVTLLSIVVTEFLIEAATTMRYRSQITGRQDLEIIAYSALETSLAVLAEIKELDEGLYSPVQGWGDPMQYAKVLSIPSGYTVKVTINDETGKLSIYEEKLDDFGNLLTEMGISYENLENLKSELKKYLDKFKEEQTQSPRNNPQRENSSNSTTTPSGNQRGRSEEEQPQPSRNNPQGENSSNPTTASGGNQRRRNGENQRAQATQAKRTLFSLNQLKEIPIFAKVFFDSKGNPNQNFQILKENVSVFNTGKVNINTAPELVKRIFLGNAGLGPVAAGKKFFKSMADIGLGQNEDRFGFKANILDIEIEVMRGPVKYHLSAMIENKNGASNASTNAPQNSQNTSANASGNQSNGSASRNSQNTSANASGNRANGSTNASRNSQNISEEASRSPSNESENKGNFSFLALTEDDSLVN